MAAHALLAGMILAFTRYGDWEPPKPSPAPVHRLPGFGRDGRDIGALQRQVRIEVSREQRDGELSRDQARSFRHQVAYIDALATRYARDGLSDVEQMELQNRLEALHGMIYAAAAGGTAK